MHTPISISDVLQRPALKNAQVLTHDAGLHRTVRWVHVLESNDAQQLLHGGELVLTTGVGLQLSTVPLENFVLELVSGDAAGLCIELGGVIHEIPQTLIETAMNYNFPLIVFPTQVRFVDITQDIHSLILSRHHRILDDLEELNQHLNRYVLGGFPSRRVLELLAKTTQTHVVCQLNDAPLEFALHQMGKFSWDVSLNHWNQLLNSIQLNENSCLSKIDISCKPMRKLGNLMLSQPIVVAGSIRGSLHFIWESNDEEADEFRTLALDRGCNALAHDEFRKLSVQERQLFYEQDFVERLITGGAKDEVTKQEESNEDLSTNETTIFYGMGLGKNPNFVYHAVIVTGNSPNRGGTQPFDWVSQRIDIAVSARLAFTGQQLECALSVRKQALVCIIAHQTGDTWRDGFQKAISNFSETLHQFIGFQEHVFVYAGGRAETLSEVRQSYKQAERMASQPFQTQLGSHSKTQTVFYEDTGIDRWLALMERHSGTDNLVADDIGQLLTYDRNHHTELLYTLKAYLDCDRSVQQAATALSIHRQTLYHRLHQIHAILENKLDNPQQRLSIHLSLYHHYCSVFEKGPGKMP